MKKVVITGASSGIGHALAEALAKGGVRVGLAARHTAPLKALKEKYPGMVEYMNIDITHPSATEHLQKLIDLLGGMDIYFHAAGIANMSGDLNPDSEAAVVATNAGGFARMVSAAYGYFRDANGGRGQIAAITSVAGVKGIGQLAAYSASKSFDQTYLTALEQLSRQQGLSISFTDIRPGWVRTPLVEAGRTYPMEMSVSYVLPKILRAVVKKKRVAVIDWRWSLLVGAWRLVPDWLWTRIDYKV